MSALAFISSQRERQCKELAKANLRVQIQRGFIIIITTIEDNIQTWSDLLNYLGCKLVQY